jgi:hypothetical protein
MSRALVYDVKPAALRGLLDKGPVADDVQASVILDDVADGVLALDFALTFAGFSYAARQLVLSVVGLLGGGAILEVFDADLANHVQCSDRTVRRWRKAHILESRTKRFALLHIGEGDYTGRKRYEKTAYSLNPAVGSYLEAVLAQARASALYARDRRAAIERAAEVHYADIPDAPPRARRRKPRRAPEVQIERAFANAARNLEKGKLALHEMADDSLSALLESNQGAELRQTLLKLQTDIAEILEDLPQAAEGVRVEEGLGQNVLTPASDSEGELSASDVAAWAEVERRAAGESRVQSREIQLLLPSPDESPPAPVMPVEDEEAEAIRAEACGLL